MKYLTPSDLKHKVQQTGSHFFDRETMQFFGDTMSNYSVSRHVVEITDSMGDTYQCYALGRKRAVKDNNKATSYFDVETFEHILPGISI